METISFPCDGTMRVAMVMRATKTTASSFGYSIPCWSTGPPNNPLFKTVLVIDGKREVIEASTKTDLVSRALNKIQQTSVDPYQDCCLQAAGCEASLSRAIAITPELQPKVEEPAQLIGSVLSLVEVCMSTDPLYVDDVLIEVLRSPNDELEIVSTDMDVSQLYGLGFPNARYEINAYYYVIGCSEKRDHMKVVGTSCTSAIALAMSGVFAPDDIRVVGRPSTAAKRKYAETHGYELIELVQPGVAECRGAITNLHAHLEKDLDEVANAYMNLCFDCDPSTMQECSVFQPTMKAPPSAPFMGDATFVWTVPTSFSSPICIYMGGSECSAAAITVLGPTSYDSGCSVPALLGLLLPAALDGTFLAVAPGRAYLETNVAAPAITAAHMGGDVTLAAPPLSGNFVGMADIPKIGFGHRRMNQSVPTRIYTNAYWGSVVERFVNITCGNAFNVSTTGNPINPVSAAPVWPISAYAQGGTAVTAGSQVVWTEYTQTLDMSTVNLAAGGNSGWNPNLWAATTWNTTATAVWDTINFVSGGAQAGAIDRYSTAAARGPMRFEVDCALFGSQLSAWNYQNFTPTLVLYWQVANVGTGAITTVTSTYPLEGSCTYAASGNTVMNVSIRGSVSLWAPIGPARVAIMAQFANGGVTFSGSSQLSGGLKVFLAGPLCLETRHVLQGVPSGSQVAVTFAVQGRALINNNRQASMRESVSYGIYDPIFTACNARYLAALGNGMPITFYDNCSHSELMAYSSEDIDQRTAKRLSAHLRAAGWLDKLRGGFSKFLKALAPATSALPYVGSFMPALTHAAATAIEPDQLEGKGRRRRNKDLPVYPNVEARGRQKKGKAYASGVAHPPPSVTGRRATRLPPFPASGIIPNSWVTIDVSEGTTDFSSFMMNVTQSGNRFDDLAVVGLSIEDNGDGTFTGVLTDKYSPAHCVYGAVDESWPDAGWYRYHRQSTAPDTINPLAMASGTCVKAVDPSWGVAFPAVVGTGKKAKGYTAYIANDNSPLLGEDYISVGRFMLNNDDKELVFAVQMACELCSRFGIKPKTYFTVRCQHYAPQNISGSSCGFAAMMAAAYGHRPGVYTGCVIGPGQSLYIDPDILRVKMALCPVLNVLASDDEAERMADEVDQPGPLDLSDKLRWCAPSAVLQSMVTPLAGGNPDPPVTHPLHYVVEEALGQLKKVRTTLLELGRILPRDLDLEEYDFKAPLPVVAFAAGKKKKNNKPIKPVAPVPKAVTQPLSKAQKKKMKKLNTSSSD
jgi:hypothetical protein